VNTATVRGDGAATIEQGDFVADDVALLRDMLTLRAYDERAVSLQRQGQIGAYPMFWGEEGIQAATMRALRDSDWVFLTYRQNGLPILRGLEPQRALQYFNGDPRAFFDPADYGCAPQCVPIATHIPHAVGWAWGRASQGADDVAVAFFGDGATSEGDFSEGMNIAGVLGAPVVFVCTNNRWAVSTPVERQTAARKLVDKAHGYGIPGVAVDGLDARAVRDVVGVAVARAREGAGPTFIEAHCYRMGPHATADDPSRYRDPAEAAAWREREPVARLAGELIQRGDLTEPQLDDMKRAAWDLMFDAAKRLDDGPPVTRRHLIEHVLSRPAPLLEAQLEGRTL
jgi:pyruvate dehydrogenase E1 component alpha subunit